MDNFFFFKDQNGFMTFLPPFLEALTCCMGLILLCPIHKQSLSIPQYVMSVLLIQKDQEHLKKKKNTHPPSFIFKVLYWTIFPQTYIYKIWLIDKQFFFNCLKAFAKPLAVLSSQDEKMQRHSGSWKHIAPRKHFHFTSSWCFLESRLAVT